VTFSPRWTSVKRLAEMEPPEAPWAVTPNFPPDAFGRFDTVERQAVLLPVGLVRAKKEPDGDVHLIGSAPTDQSVELVVEFPSIFCTDARANVAGNRTRRTAHPRAVPGR
jgi:hypothetical protein